MCYLHSLFLPDSNVFFYMFSTIHPYLPLFSHFVFLFSLSFSCSSHHEISYNLQCLIRFHYNLPVISRDKKTLIITKTNTLIIFGTNYELFLPLYQITFFLAFGQAKIFFSDHILINILIYMRCGQSKSFVLGTE